MDWNQLITTIIQLAIFSIFITAIIEVIKGISAVGLLGLLKGLIKTLFKNEDMKSESFPVLNFMIALLCCWAFNVGVMHTFASSLGAQSLAQPIAKWIDYFGTASVTYLGSDQLFKRFLAVEKDAKNFADETKKNVNTLN